MKTVLLVLAALLSLNVRASGQDKNFYIFLSFGQSNMEGFPGIEEQDQGPVDERFQALAAVDFPEQHREMRHWYTAVPPLARPNTGLGPSDYFGRTMVAHLPADTRVGVVNVSVAGCKIELFDKDNYASYTETAPSWMKNIIGAYGGNPYQHLVDMAKLAQKDGVIKGILLHQGESNTNDKEWPIKVKHVYDNLIKDLNLNSADVPLLAGELVGADRSGACASMNAIIDNLPKTIPTSYVISSVGCPCRPDHLHFTPAGYRELGKRYGEKMLSLLAASTPRVNAGAPASAQGTTVYRDLAYVSNGHPRQMLDLYLPGHAKHPPLIVMIHGGAFLFGDKADENFAKFTNAGYGVASINYRLSSDSIFPAQIEDCKAAVRWLRANAAKYGYDPNRIGAYGESAGGNMAAMLGATGDIKTYDIGENLSVSSRVQAVVDYFGPTDYLQMDAHGLPGGWNNDAPDSPASRLIGGPIQKNKDKTERANPITYITPKSAPFFIAHGDADNIVPHHQSELLLVALQKAGIPATIYTVSGAGHGFQDATADKLAIEFFGKYLHSMK